MVDVRCYKDELRLGRKLRPIAVKFTWARIWRPVDDFAVDPVAHDRHPRRLIRPFVERRMEDFGVGHVLHKQKRGRKQGVARGVRQRRLHVKDRVVVIVEVRHGTDADLAQVGRIVGGVRLFQHFLEHRQGDARQDGDDHDDDEEFDEGEGLGEATAGIELSFHNGR